MHRFNLLRKSLRQSILLTLLLAAWSPGRVGAQAFLVSSHPPNGATDVPLSASFVFTFNTPMFTESLILLPPNLGIVGSIQFSANLTGAMTPSWDETATVLTINYEGNLPAGALITWTINPPNTTYPLYSEEIDIVPTTSGSFTTGGESCDPDGIPDDYGGVSLAKWVTYSQTSTAAPVLKGDELPVFNAFISSPDVNAVTGATLTGPGAVNIPLTGLAGSYFAVQEFSTQAALDAAYPSGVYSFSLSRETGGPTQFQMPMLPTPSYPPVPQVTNHDQAQMIDPTQDFTLTFNSLTSASGSDFIRIEILDSQSVRVLTAPDLCVPLPLPNTAMSFVIPAGTLAASQTYTLRLSFARSFYASTTAPPNFSSVGTLQRQTVMTIATTAGGQPQPQLTLVGFPSGFFAFDVGNLQPATNYRVQYSSTLAPGSWQLLQNVNTTTPMPITDLTSSQTSGRRYYRVITP
jgi:hypothetical protein